MVKSIIRTDNWNLNPSTEDKICLQATVDEYRAFCKALSYVILGHWVRLQNADSKCAAIEKLIHQTKKNSKPKHKYFVTRFWKFPGTMKDIPVIVRVRRIWAGQRRLPVIIS